MEYKYILGILATIVAFVSYIPYFRNIFRGKTKPHAFSWLVWMILAAMTFFAQISQGAGAGAWVTGFTALICLGVFLLALKRGEKKIVLFDWFCLASAILILIFYILTNDPLLSIVLIIAVDTLGFVPTVRKSYLRPYEETLSLYAVNCIKFTLSLAALENFTVVTALYPATWLAMNILFSAMLVIRRKQLKEI